MVLDDILSYLEEQWTETEEYLTTGHRVLVLDRPLLSIIPTALSGGNQDEL